jgi:hypothetical protein
LKINAFFLLSIFKEQYFLSSSTISAKNDDEVEDANEEDEEEEDDEDNEDVASSEEKLFSNVSEEKNLPTQRSTPGYVNIRRTKAPSTTDSSRYFHIK